MRAPAWQLARGRRLDLSAARVIGILNVTPDSFHDGGRWGSVEGAVSQAARMVSEGAAMLDVGGESTRPGAERVGPDEQIARVVPVIRAIREAGIEAALSVDTTLARVGAATLEAGADAVNDVSAGTEDPAMFDLVRMTGAGLVLMHRLVAPGGDRYSTRYEHPPVYGEDDDAVVRVVRAFLEARADAARAAGIAREAIVLDPGLGFGKSVAQNYRLIGATAALGSLGYPILSAASRKSFTGAAFPGETVDVGGRLSASIAVSVLQYGAGVRLFRVHDVAAHVRAIAVARRVAPDGGHAGVGESR